MADDATLRITIKARFKGDALKRYGDEMELNWWDGSINERAIIAHVQNWIESDLNRSALGDYAEIECVRGVIDRRDTSH